MNTYKQRIFALLLFLLIIEGPSFGQAFTKIIQPSDSATNFLQLSQKISRFYDTAQGSNRSGYKQWKRFEWYALNHISEDGTLGNYQAKNIEGLKQMKTQQVEQSSLTNSSTGNWINIGYGSSVGTMAKQGRVNTIAFDPVNSDVIYAGAAGGGIWKSVNGGANWFNLSIDLPALGISDIAVAPAPNNNIVYALSGEGISPNVYSHSGIGILKSYDGGTTWENTGPVYQIIQSIAGNKLLIHPSNPNYVLAAMTNGLWRSMDGGSTWNNIYPNDVIDIEFKPNDLNILYATVRGRSDLIKINLTTLAPTSVYIIAPPTPPTNAPAIDRMEIGVSANNGNAVYVLAGPGYQIGTSNLFYGLYYSGDGGNSFSLRSNSCVANGDLFNSIRNASFYTNTIYVNPFNENNVIVGGLNLFTSFDGGVTLNQVVDGDLHPDIHELKRNAVSGDLWLCTDGGIYKSINSGSSWTSSSNGLVINEVYRISGTQTTTDNLIAGLQDNAHMLRAANTNVYFPVYNSDGMDNYFNSFNNSIVYACSQNGGLSRSTDGGFNYNGTTLPGNGNANLFPWLTPIVQHPPNVIPFIITANTDVLYVYGTNGIIQGSSNGTVWTPMGPAGAAQVNGALTPSMAISSDDLGTTATLYISNGTNFWVHTNPISANAGGWVSRPLPLSAFSFISAIAVNPANKNEVWVTISGYASTQKVFRSTNAGINWTNMTLSLPNIPVYSIVFANKNNSPTGAVYIGTEIGVFYKDDNLPNWVPFTNGLPHVPVTDLQINYTNLTLKAATYGRGIWQSDLFQNCTLTVLINFNIFQGQYNFEASSAISANSTINGNLGTRVTMKAGNKITWSPGFRASNGSYIRAVIGNCGSGVLSSATDSTLKPITEPVKPIKANPLINTGSEKNN